MSLRESDSDRSNPVITHEEFKYGIAELVPYLIRYHSATLSLNSIPRNDSKNPIYLIPRSNKRQPRKQPKHSTILFVRASECQ